MNEFYIYVKALNKVLLGLAIQYQKDYPQTSEGFAKDVNFLSSQNWEVFEFTQENVESLYDKLRYTTICDIMDFANNYGLDKNIDYEKIKQKLEYEKEME